MLVPSGANSRPPCASKLCGPVPKYEFHEEEGRVEIFCTRRRVKWSEHGTYATLITPPKPQQPYLDPTFF